MWPSVLREDFPGEVRWVPEVQMAALPWPHMCSHVYLPREVGVITLSLHRRKPRLRERKKLA